MSLSNTSLPKPKNWQDFEAKIRELFACVLNDPNTQQNGRSGQKQNGVDVYGYRNDTYLVGVQCKKKLEDKVTEKELRGEVEKAKNFKPKINEFILTTTAPRDQKIQEIARIITEELAQSDHPIRVYVWGWDDIEEHVSKYASTLKAFDPSWNPLIEEAFAKISLEIQDIKQSVIKPVHGTITSSYTTSVTLNGNDENTPLHGEITAFQRLIDEGYIQIGLQQILKLKSDKWADANRSERYRILIGIASAKLKMGKQDDAANMIIDAFNECPEHKNARKNLAAGHLLKNNYVEARKLARQMLEDDNTNSFAAGILIQSFLKDMTCNDPIKCIPEVLCETEDVLIAHIHFMRCRGELSWVKLAQIGAKKHPDNRVLKIFSAEAVLDEIISNDRDMAIGGIPRNNNIDKLNCAVEVLYEEACNAIDKEYSVLPCIGHNAVLALRLTNDTNRAKRILNAFLRQYPDDENLCLQQALIMLSENDPNGALAILPDNSSNPEIIALVASALTATGESGKALDLIESIDESNVAEHVKIECLFIRIRSYIKRGEKQLAINSIAQRIAEDPKDLSLRALQVQTYNIIGDVKSANEALENALILVDEKTDLSCRLTLGFEGSRLNRDDVVIDLLKGRMATDYESEGLHLLLTASINSGHWATAHEILGSLSINLRDKEWFKKAEIILALKTGDKSADEKIAQYLKLCPNDVDILLARVGIWQSEGRNIDICRFLNNLVLTDFRGHPEKQIKLASLICHYDNLLKGLQYAYAVIMDNWNIPQVHLVYQSIIFFNDNIGEAMPSTDVITENTVACLLTQNGERRYRIEKEKHVFFEDERINLESDLATLLIGKQVGDKFKFQDYSNTEPAEVIWIKSIYLDAFHRSLEQFNERFPNADGLQLFTFDSDAPDPLENIREVTKARAEASQHILKEYQTKNIPLSFIAALLGNDPLDAYYSLQSVNVKFKVCHGFAQERDSAFRTIQKHEKNGCVLDAITLALVHRLGIYKAIVAVCGPIYTSKSVIDFLVSRVLESKLNIERKQGFIGWHKDKLVYEEYNRETLVAIAEEREKEASWARNATIIAPAMPKKDFSKEIKPTINMAGPLACDPAIVAEGNNLLLLSEDMGFRSWSEVAFNISATWLQPVLICARDEGYLTQNKYCEVINSLVLGGHTYVSLDPHCLIFQASKNNFILTNEFICLLKMVGGASADLTQNTGVLANFIDMLWQKCSDKFKVKRIISESFNSFVNGRQEDYRLIIWLILKKTRMNREIMNDHALNWLIGHSIGMPFFNELMQIKRKYYQANTMKFA